MLSRSEKIEIRLGLGWELIVVFVLCQARGRRRDRDSTLGATEARKRFSELIKEGAYQHEPMV